MFDFNPLDLIAGIPGLIIAMVIHEYAHARVAVALGDRTPMLMGRLSFGVYQVFQLIIIYNINFAIFNLIPLPPLDGSHVLMQLLPPKMAYSYARLERYSFLILIALIMTPVLSMIFIPLQRLIWQIFVLLLMPFF